MRKIFFPAVKSIMQAESISQCPLGTIAYTRAIELISGPDDVTQSLAAR